MRIDNINSNISSKGLYFTKTSNVIFNKIYNYKTDNIVKTSQHGFKYIENTNISQSVKDRFANIPFIKELSEQFDTFIFFSELPKKHKNNVGGMFNLALSRISWADLSKKGAEIREARGCSPISQELATDKMFKNIEQQNFCDIN